MNITIIGWYGTETIGDRAILAGLLSLFSKTFAGFNVKLGSLFPFFSDRTIYEDYDFWKDLCQQDVQIEIFNSRNSRELDRAITATDLVVMGGGPLMDTVDLYMIEYAFRKARKLGKITALLGCGVGPLFGKSYRRSVLEIARHSSIIILRDTKSYEALKKIYNEFSVIFPDDSVCSSFDPAVQCAIDFSKRNNRSEQEYIAINLRSFPVEYSQKSHDINAKLLSFVKCMAEKYKCREIRLIPMHYFYIGNDDREFLNFINLSLFANNINVQNTNLSLKQTMETFANAYFNIGMRFHSVVLQTLTSGKNYIFDYTEPHKGKIIGFVNDIDIANFYRDRYVCLQTDDININMISNETDEFHVCNEVVNSKLNIYLDTLRGLVSSS